MLSMGSPPATHRRLKTLATQLAERSLQPSTAGGKAAGSAGLPAHLPATHRKLYITAPKQCEMVEEPMPACPHDGVLVKTTTTCMSIGTELRCYRSRPPPAPPPTPQMCTCSVTPTGAQGHPSRPARGRRRRQVPARVGAVRVPVRERLLDRWARCGCRAGSSGRVRRRGPGGTGDSPRRVHGGGGQVMAYSRNPYGKSLLRL